MKKIELEQAVAKMENLLREFREAKTRGKETNSNEERVQSISDIKEITQRLETYIRSNDELLEEISGIKVDRPGEIDWDDIVRPKHFEEDLAGEIDKLKKRAS